MRRGVDKAYTGFESGEQGCPGGSVVQARIQISECARAESKLCHREVRRADRALFQILNRGSGNRDSFARTRSEPNNCKLAYLDISRYRSGIGL